MISQRIPSNGAAIFDTTRSYRFSLKRWWSGDEPQITFIQHGPQVSDKTYLVTGDEWMLEGDIIKFPTWLNIVGLHSGYKLTRLEGRYNDPNLELRGKRTVITLNGGDDNFFKTV
jgi:hypothetical protein